MVAVQVGAVQGTAITAGGPTQTFTASGMTETPKAAILFVSLGVTNGTAANGALLCVGITDGVTSKCSTSIHENTGANSNANRRGASTLLQVINIATGAVLAQASWVSFSAGAITVQWDTSTFALPAAAYKIGVYLIGGTAVSAKVGSTLLTGSPLNAATTQSGIGFDPEDIFFVQDRSNFDNVARAVARTVLGIASIDHSQSPREVSQICFSMGENDNLAAADVWMRVMPSVIGGRIAKTTNTAGDGVGFELIGADAVGGGRFVIRARDVASTNEGVGWLALNYSELVPHIVKFDVTPAATGNNVHSLAFKAQGALLIASRTGTLGSTDGSANGGGIGISALTLAAQAAMGISTRDAGVALTRSIANANAMEVPADGGGVGLRATLNNFNVGVSLNYTTVLASPAAMAIWAIGEPFISNTVTSAPYAWVAPAVAVTVNKAVVATAAPWAWVAPLVNVTLVSNPPINLAPTASPFAWVAVAPVVSVTGLTALAIQHTPFAWLAPAPAVTVNKVATVQPSPFAWFAPPVVVTLQAVTNITLNVLPAIWCFQPPLRGVFLSTTQPASFKGEARFGGAQAGQGKFGGTAAGMTRFGQP